MEQSDKSKQINEAIDYLRRTENKNNESKKPANNVEVSGPIEDSITKTWWGEIKSSLKNLVSSLIYSSAIISVVSLLLYFLYNHIIVPKFTSLPYLSFLEISAIYITVKIFRSF